MPDQPAPNLEEARRIAAWVLGEASGAPLDEHGDRLDVHEREVKLADVVKFLLGEREAREEQLAEHYPMELRCDHDAKTDTIFCNCGHQTEAEMSVWKAKLAWANHVLAALPATESTQACDEQRHVLVGDGGDCACGEIGRRVASLSETSGTPFFKKESAQAEYPGPEQNEWMDAPMGDATETPTERTP